MIGGLGIDALRQMTADLEEGALLSADPNRARLRALLLLPKWGFLSDAKQPPVLRPLSGGRLVAPCFPGMSAHGVNTRIKACIPPG